MLAYFNDEAREREPEEPDESELSFDESLLDDCFLRMKTAGAMFMYPGVTA
jgi:hypothetical protein